MATDLVDLRVDDHKNWQELTLPDSETPVRMRRLHVDPETKASVSVVRFPAGWHRPVTGHYTAAEELVVLEGAIEVVAEHRAGEYVYLPPRTVRTDTRCARGALVIAYFSGVPQWIEGRPDVPPPGAPVHGRPAGVMRDGAAEARGSFRAVEQLPAEPLPADSDILHLADLTWEWVPAGTVPKGRGPAVVRSWA